MDSELGVVISDENHVDLLMNGKPFLGGKLPHELRVRLWKEHLGLLSDPLCDISDPICANVYNELLLGTAKKNTQIYEEVFPSVPSNRHKTLRQFEADGGFRLPYQPASDGSRLSHIQGFLTIHPIGFLRDEEMATLGSTLIGARWWQ